MPSMNDVMKTKPMSSQLWMRCLLACCFVGLVLPIAAYAESSKVSSGEEVYRDYCSVCHGDRGDGMTRVRRGLNPPPRDFTTKLAKAELSVERMVNSITHGRPGTAMMSFSSRLSSDEIASVVAYIRDNFMVGEEVEVTSHMVTYEMGKNAYVSNCAVCHGDDGNGAMWTKTSLNPPPRDFTTLQAMDELSRERMLTSVTHGRPGTAMMSFSKNLSAKEIEAVVDYIRHEFIGRSSQMQSGRANVPSTGHPHAATSPHGHTAQTAPVTRQPDADMSLGFPGELSGRVELGEVFFMANCSACHGKQGDGNGPRSKFIQPKPRNFLSTESRRLMNRPALYRSIALGKPGTVMPSWDKVLTAQQIADVAEYVFSTFILSAGDEEELVPEDTLPEGSEKKKVES